MLRLRLPKVSGIYDGIIPQYFSDCLNHDFQDSGITKIKKSRQSLNLVNPGSDNPHSQDLINKRIYNLHSFDSLLMLQILSKNSRTSAYQSRLNYKRIPE